MSSPIISSLILSAATATGFTVTGMYVGKKIGNKFSTIALEQLNAIRPESNKIPHHKIKLFSKYATMTGSVLGGMAGMKMAVLPVFLILTVGGMEAVFPKPGEIDPRR